MLLLLRDLAMMLLSAALLGWGAGKVGLSPIVGYLAAGIIIGTPEIPFLYLGDSARMNLLSQLGLVFLMFAIGLDLRIHRLRALGWPVALAVALAALFNLNLVRGISGLIGMTPDEGLFFAAMLMVSSSSIIGKLLQASPQRHERHGQLALGFTLLEDIVAVILLTLLSAQTRGEASGWEAVMETLGATLLFILLLGVAGFLLLPRLLKEISRGSGRELETVLMAGLLFASAALALNLGFSLALGAFLIGLVVSETSRRSHFERVFRGMRDVFLAVFFVATGMAFDWRLVDDAWLLIVVGSVLAIILRSAAVSLALIIACEGWRTAVRTGINVVAVGEFSFVIAGVGLSAHVLDGRFAAAAIGISLITSALAPFCMNLGDRLASAADRLPPWLLKGDAAYRAFWSMVAARSQRNLFWRLSRKRIIQIVVEILLVTGILVAAEPVHTRLLAWTGLEAAWSDWAFWAIVALGCLPALIAIFRNIDALILIAGDAWMRDRPSARQLQAPFGVLARAFAFGSLSLWFVSFLSLGSFGGWGLLALAILLVATGAITWRRLIRWHSEREVEIEQILSGETSLPGGLSRRSVTWGLEVAEVELPEEAEVAGRSLRDLDLRAVTGATVLTVDRHGVSVVPLRPETMLYSGDIVLLLGEAEQLARGRALLSVSSVHSGTPELSIHDAITESIRIAAGHPWCGKSLAQLALPARFGVAVAAIRRGKLMMRSPGGDAILDPGDEVLLIGSPESLRTATSG